MSKSITDILKENILIFDGAMGTMLQKAGLPVGGLPELFNITHPETVANIHKAYIEAGCDIVTTNTFQANRFKLKDCGHTVSEIISSGVSIAKNSGSKYVALDIGPLGQMMRPMVTMT